MSQTADETFSQVVRLAQLLHATDATCTRLVRHRAIASCYRCDMQSAFASRGSFTLPMIARLLVGFLVKSVDLLNILVAAGFSPQLHGRIESCIIDLTDDILNARILNNIV